MTTDWEWRLTATGKSHFDGLDEYGKERIASKLDEIVTDQWREPADYLEPLAGAPHEKLRVGPFRLACRLDRSTNMLYVLSIRKRGGDAYRGDDWRGNKTECQPCDRLTDAEICFDGLLGVIRLSPMRQASPVSLTRRSIPAYYGGE